MLRREREQLGWAVTAPDLYATEYGSNLHRTLTTVSNFCGCHQSLNFKAGALAYLPASVSCH